MNDLLIVDNCTAHKIEESDIPERLSLLFLLTNLKITRQPAGMGMIASPKVGYKSIMLTFLLRISYKEYGFEAASQAWARYKLGCHGLAYWGKPCILDEI